MNLKEKLLKFKTQAEGLLAQDQRHHNPVKTITPGMPELLRRAAAEGAVLLENNGVLPFAENTCICLFGRVQLDWFYTGYGSGGDVNYPYAVNLLEGLRHCKALRVNESLAQTYEDWTASHPASHGLVWGSWPRCHPEMPVTDALVQEARQNSHHAVIVIGRASGEDRENILEKGSYYLTDQERALLKAVTAQFPDAVLILNIGAIMDLSFLDDFSFGAVLIAWQGGMESGNAVADILCGKVSPCGRLPDTVALTYEDHPSASHFGAKGRNEYYEDIYVGYRYFETFAPQCVRYPFGFGRSYTTFTCTVSPIESRSFAVELSNTGPYCAKETVMLFVEKPQGLLGNPARELVSFRKTRTLSPGESQTLTLSATNYQLSSYDDSGKTGHKSSYILQKGTYRFYIGSDVRSAEFAGEYTVETDTVVKQLSEAAAPVKPFPILTRINGEKAESLAAPKTTDLAAIILQNLPQSVPLTGDNGYKLSDVAAGNITLDQFLAQLTETELEAISRGGYIMGNPLGAKGNAGIFGGVSKSLRKKGIPVITTTDGPSGIRLYDSCSLLPIGTLLSSTFDLSLMEELFAAVGQEMKLRGSDVLLAPGMNIHRNPLCGRNFEYFSEDPYLTGRIAAAQIKGLQSQGVAACPKHFACNNQEFDRYHNDSVLSERALREIYLKGFEICVKLASPKTLMTSYNKINSVWAHYHYELVNTILRQEWGFSGLVITDWWMRYAPSPEFPQLTGNAYRLRARVDILMPGARNLADPLRKSDGTALSTYGKKDGITLGELQESARNVLKFTLSFLR